MSQHSQNTDLKKLLHESKDKYGHSLFDHLCQILSHIDTNQAEATLEEFENLSYFLRSSKFAYKQFEADEVVNNRKPTDPHGLQKHYRKVLQLLQEHQHSAQAYVQDFVEANNDMNIAGLGFGEDEAKLIHLTLERLAAKNPTESISFLGIIKGSRKDYYVAYGRLRKHVKDQLAESWEPNGQGANALTFWVTNESRIELILVLSEWIELPAIGPDHIQAGRFIKHVVTGELNAPVNAFPEFPGKEKHFLKTQLVRLMHNCEIIPQGMYRPSEDETKRKL